MSKFQISKLKFQNYLSLQLVTKCILLIIVIGAVRGVVVPTNSTSLIDDDEIEITSILSL